MRGRFLPGLMVVAAALLGAPGLGALTAVEEGEQLFLADKPGEARPRLVEALNADPTNERLYLYLGIVYEQLGDPDRAIAVMRRGLNVAQNHRDLLLFNMGNNFFLKNELTLATEMYTSAIADNTALSAAYLNRANARLQLGEYPSALADYSTYLNLEPRTGQRSTIEQVVALLSRRIETARQDQIAQQERDAALMNAVLNSLKNASANAKNLSAGSAAIEEDYQEIDIDD